MISYGTAMNSNNFMINFLNVQSAVDVESFCFISRTG